MGDNRDPQSWAESSPAGFTFCAVFHAYCAECDTMIEPGDRVGIHHRGGYICMKCTEVPF